jgi:hypothetical protein
MNETTSLEIARAMELTEARAWADMYRAAPAGMAVATGLETRQAGDVTVLDFRANDVPMFNRAFPIGLVSPATEAEIDALVTHFRERGSKGFRLQLSPFSQPLELRDWLRARGLQPRLRWAKVYRGIAPIPPVSTRLEVREVGPEAAGDFSQAACAGYGMPPLLRPWLEALVGRPGWRAYVAYDGGDPVGGGALFTTEGVGWLGVAATRPTHRGQGAQSALMARRIEDAITAGCHTVVTETGEDTLENPNPSYRNMIRAGRTGGVRGP